jgi:hypothetical protein
MVPHRSEIENRCLSQLGIFDAFGWQKVLAWLKIWYNSCGTQSSAVVFDCNHVLTDQKSVPWEIGQI